jgi:thioredoxin reductase (NADPH)
MEKVFDIVIIGAGPAGMSAGIYAKRSGLDVMIIEKSVPGGAITSSFEVSNYPGFVKISGMELATKMFEQVSSFGVPFEYDEVNRVTHSGDLFTVECLNHKFSSRAVIVAEGASVRKLNLENERKFIGKGISYCATCDGNFFKDKTVALVGGGNTALEDAFYLSNICKKIFLIHRRDEFRGQEILVNRIKNTKNIELVLNSTVTKLFGDEKLEKIEVTDKFSNAKTILEVSGLFVCIGRGPDTDMLPCEVKKNEAGYIVTDQNMKTNIDGLYATGDIRETPLRQVVTACSDGAIAATKIFEFLKTKEKANQSTNPY